MSSIGNETPLSGINGNLNPNELEIISLLQDPHEIINFSNFIFNLLKVTDWSSFKLIFFNFFLHKKSLLPFF